MTEKQERLVKAYDAEAWPLYGQRFAEMITRAFLPGRAARLLILGGATGQLPLSLTRTLDPASRVNVLEPSPTFAAAARRRAESDPALAFRIAIHDAPSVASATLSSPIATTLPLPFETAAFDRAVANVAAIDTFTAEDALTELARGLRPGGRLVAALPLRGTWSEFLDIYRGVLRDNRKTDSLAALGRYVAALPEDDAPASWLEKAGLRDVKMSVERWELLFKSAREFFFAPVIEQGPLPRWKQIAGRGDEMQDIFFFIKEAIDAYFAGSVFAVSVVAGCVQATKP